MVINYYSSSYFEIYFISFSLLLYMDYNLLFSKFISKRGSSIIYTQVLHTSKYIYTQTIQRLTCRDWRSNGVYANKMCGRMKMHIGLCKNLCIFITNFTHSITSNLKHCLPVKEVFQLTSHKSQLISTRNPSFRH